MRITLSSRIVALTIGAAVAAGAQALLPQAATAAAPKTHATHQARRAHVARAVHPTQAARTASVVRKLDTADGRARAAAASSAAWLTGDTAGRGLRLVHGGPVAAAVGKVFFTLESQDFVCSGALVRSEHAYVVLTAAHCVRNGRGQWATNWTFVPGYNDGAEPYGQYTARRFFVSPRWTGPSTGSERYDVAFVRVTPVTPEGARRRRPAGLPIRFGASQTAAAGSAYVVGYPALPPYSGLYANYCAGRAAASATRPGSVRTPCTMTAGDSGGPWLAGFSPRAGTGTITAVTAYKLSGNLRTLYGTVLGPSARALYLSASGHG
jgi:V8-like Glu-specific endopeptidase